MTDRLISNSYTQMSRSGMANSFRNLSELSSRAEKLREEHFRNLQSNQETKEVYFGVPSEISKSLVDVFSNLDNLKAFFADEVEMEFRQWLEGFSANISVFSTYSTPATRKVLVVYQRPRVKTDGTRNEPISYDDGGKFNISFVVNLADNSISDIAICSDGVYSGGYKTYNQPVDSKKQLDQLTVSRNAKRKN